MSERNGAVSAPLIIDDRPIVSPREDQMDRKEFARHVASAIGANRSSNSLVVSLVGPWGSGKTSLLNLVEYSLKNDGKTPAPIIVRFNPWLFADQNQLSRRFFQAIALAFKREHDPSLSRPARALSLDDDAGRLAQLVEDYAAIFEPLHFLGPAGDAALTGLRGIAGFVRAETKRRADDLEGLKDRINGTLRKLDRRVIVMIDDIDRLNATEIIQVFQLVRLVGDFDNTTYLLAFDRAVVGGVLKDVQRINGDRYLEKIVQVSLNVPAIPAHKLYGLAERSLRGIVAGAGLPEPDEKRLRLLLPLGERYFLKDPRKVARLLNMFRFSLALLEHDRDVIDLLGITMLQVFAPDVYERIRDHEDTFAIGDDTNTGPLADQTAAKEERDRIRAIFTGLVTEDDRQQMLSFSELTDLLRLLFPRVDTLFYGQSSSPEVLASLRGRKGVGHQAFFSAYFQFALPSAEFSEEDWKNVLRAVAGGPEAQAIDATAPRLLNFAVSGDMASFYDKLATDLRRSLTKSGSASDTATIEQRKRLARLLLYVGDQVCFATAEAEQDALERTTLKIVADLMMAVGNENERYKLLLHAYDADNPTFLPLPGLYVALLFLTGIRVGLKRPSLLGDLQFAGGNGFPEIIDAGSHLENLEICARSMVWQWLHDHPRTDERSLIETLCAWYDLDAANFVATYLDELFQTDNGLVTFLRACALSRDRYARRQHDGGAFFARVATLLRASGAEAACDRLATRIRDPNLADIEAVRASLERALSADAKASVAENGAVAQPARR